MVGSRSMSSSKAELITELSQPRYAMQGLLPTDSRENQELAARMENLGELVRDLTGAESFITLVVSQDYHDLYPYPQNEIATDYAAVCLQHMLEMPEGKFHRYLLDEVYLHGSVPVAVLQEAAVLNANSYIRLPLLFNDQPIGVIALVHSADDHFTDTHFQAAHHLANMAAALVENSLFRRHYRTNQAVEQVAVRMAHLISTYPDVDRVLDEIVREAMQLTDANGATVMLLEADGDTLYVAAQTGESIFQDVGMHQSFQDLLNLIANGSGRLIGVPLVSNEEMIGVLLVSHYFEDEAHNASVERGLAILERLAPLVATAIEKARLQQTLRQERRQLQSILDNISVPVLLFDAAYNLLMVNPEAHHVSERLKITFEAGQNGQDILEQLPASVELPEAVEIGRAFNLDLRHAGQFIVEIAQIPGAIPNTSEGYVIVAQDVTAQRELDRTKSELLHVLSHDLGNILTLAVGYAALAAEDDLEPEEYPEIMQKVYTALMRAKNLIGDVVEIERPKQSIKKDYSIVLAAQEAVAGQGDFAEQKQQELTLTINTTPPDLFGNPLLIKQAIENIVSNAIKYTPPTGSISVTLDADDHDVYISVQDTGYGIPPEELSEIWSRFYRVKAEHTSKVEGTGLGLTLVRSVIESHGGLVWAESEVGVGSIFHIQLPIIR